MNPQKNLCPFKPGDRVRFIRSTPPVYSNKEMEQVLGDILTVTKIMKHNAFCTHPTFSQDWVYMHSELKLVMNDDEQFLQKLF